jgi:peptidoglycan-associated lipoprotein
MTFHMRAPLLVLAGALSLGACAKKTAPTQPAPSPTQTAGAAAPAHTGHTGPSAEEMRRAALERAMAVLSQHVLFDYDRAEISEESQRLLSAKVPVLREFPDIRILIEGHADERGSVEYNIALGMRRSGSVRDYLVGFGINADRFDLQSWGEDRPLVQGSGEQAWSQNRRAEFSVRNER